MRRRHYSTIAFAPLLAGSTTCIADPSDPHEELGRASYLFDRANRPLPAEPLIRKAIDACTRVNDQACIADGWLVDGFFFRSRSVGGQEKLYRKYGFLDKTASFDDRYDKSIEYFEKAADAYSVQQRFDRASNAYLNTGFTFAIEGRRTDACAAFEKSLDSYKQNIKLHRDAKPDVPQGFGNFEEFLSSERQRIGCPV